jgi:hypothetical protein
MEAKTPALKTTRLLVQGDFFIDYAWEARGNGVASTVTPAGWRKLKARLTEADKALVEAWRLQPDDPIAPTLMLKVELGLRGDRQEMEKWFERAMKADGNNKEACEAKMNWLDPKWHGSLEEMLAFGRACRDTKNARAGIPLLLAHAHYRFGRTLPEDQDVKYYRTKEVWNDIRSVHEAYLQQNPLDHTNRSFYAAFCFMCGQYAESDKQFKILGDKLVWTAGTGSLFPEKWMKDVRSELATWAKQQADRKAKTKK